MIEFYAVQTRPGEWIAYEKHPIPGGNPMAVVARRTKALALADARAFNATRGSAFAAERAVVGCLTKKDRKEVCT